MGLLKDLRKNVKSMDETMDHTDEEIEHFRRVLDSTEDSVAKLCHCIAHAEGSIQNINQLTNHGEELVSKLQSLVKVVGNRELIVMSFYGVIVGAFLISILVVENLISSLIVNGSRSDMHGIISFFGGIFDYMLLSVICFILRVFQLLLFTIVSYYSLESVKKSILKQVDVEVGTPNTALNIQIPSSIIVESSSKNTPSITLSTTPKTLSNENSERESNPERPLSSLANNASSSTQASRSDLASFSDHISNSDISSDPSPSPALSEVLRSSMESALQMANSVSVSRTEQTSSNHTNAL